MTKPNRLFCSGRCRSRHHNERYRRHQEHVREMLDDEIDRLQALREKLNQ